MTSDSSGFSSVTKTQTVPERETKFLPWKNEVRVHRFPRFHLGSTGLWVFSEVENYDSVTYNPRLYT